MRQKNTGRRASSTERALAKQLVDDYRRAKESPTGSICLNPESPECDREYFYANPEELLEALAAFAEHGTFQPLYEIEFEAADIQAEFDGLRRGGLTYEAAVDRLSKSHNKAPRTIERILARDTPLYVKK